MIRLVLAVCLFALISAGLTGCTQSFASRLDDRTFRIEGPPIPGGSSAPNRQLAEKICPHGYRVLNEERRKPEADTPIATTWTIRCL